MSRPRSALVAAILVAAATLLGGCAITPDPASPPPGTLTVAVDRDPQAPSPIGGSTFEARLTAADGGTDAWTLEDGAVPLTVAPGRYELEVWTVHHSDVLECVPDPDADGGQRCQMATYPPVATCSLIVDVVPNGVLRATYRYLPRDRCTLLVDGPASG